MLKIRPASNKPLKIFLWALTAAILGGSVWALYATGFFEAALMASVSWRWCMAQVPVVRRGRILERSDR